MATQLQIYNNALLMMKERRVTSSVAGVPNEDREARRILDDWYSQVVQFCLEQGMWKFAMRATTLTQSGAGLYGFTYQFSKPSDIVHLFLVGDTVDYDPPLVYTFVDEADKLYANSTTLRLRYSSNGASYGGNLTNWPAGFAFYVSAELAAWTSYAITGNDKLAMMLDRKAKILLANSLSLYGMVAPPGMLPFNAWARSITANEAINLRPDMLPFGTEIKASMTPGGGNGN